ncbi:MAG TPA: DUF4129 domain-containing protein [Ktedonobacterales bacterium]
MSNGRQLWLSPEWANKGLHVALLTMLEILPIQACLLMYAAGTTSMSVAFGPLWLIVAAILAFALIRQRVGEREALLVMILSVLLGASVCLLFAALSPTAYGDVAGGLFSTGWVNALRRDALYDTARFNGLFSIVPFVFYLGWRGLTLGAGFPRAYVTLRRFAFGLAVIIVACVGALSVPKQAQPELESVLLLLVALEAFAGLAAAAMARRDEEQTAAVGADARESTRWLLNAFGAAALVVGVAFLIGLTLDLSLATPITRALGSLGAIITTALSWLTEHLAYLLWILFVKTLGAWFFKNKQFIQMPKEEPGAIASKTHKQPVIVPPPHQLVVAAEIIISALVVGTLLYIIYRLVAYLLRAQRAPTDPEMDEEREGLNEGGLLRRQLADLLGRLRGAFSTEPDPLQSGGVRWHFREVLRAGTAAGLARRDGETADEYGRRIAAVTQVASVAGPDASLSTLTTAYDDARYGERERPAAPAVAAEAKRLTDALRRLRGR